ncbi:hypothetical protein VIGAN_04010000 [Vigna angularis var. angularis]|uniref:Bifunctional inhibitor/plant lipid transfer protein/seed storage helical domain-containing protein n=1 Tax=Vigna angularis var. angularis TaxID=157739 RepID=A0A0S3RRG1_PHAAN|nr:hypothetical protein VIGAN_04010000 [Vigna angularis var. angularis]
MTMKKSVVSAVVLVALLLIDVGPLAQAACSASQLTPCIPAITSSSPPSSTCCAKLNEQKPCLCGYLKNPALKQPSKITYAGVRVAAGERDTSTTYVATAKRDTSPTDARCHAAWSLE